jgi:hypothetical protein
MTKDEKMDRALDAALEMTFPASDPIAVYTREPRPRKANAETSAKTERAARPSGGWHASNHAVASIS